MKLDNAAHRLLVLLEKFSEFKDDAKTRNVWRQLLNLEDEPDYILMARLGAVMSLPSQIIATMNKNFPNERRWKASTHWVNKVDAMFKHNNLNGNWIVNKREIDNTTIAELGFLSILIETKGHTEELDSVKLSEFKDKINDLKEEIIQSDISENLKECFTKYLNKVIESIDLYEITGVEPIIEAIESTLGHSFVDADYRSAIQGEGFGRKLMVVLNDVAVAVTLAQGLPAIGIAVMNLLPK